jgi:tRNA nucleotidyltransferase (CCA-adding enzyme)
MKMNIPEPARKIIDRLNEHGYEAYVVGGCVRDMILKREPGDWDITTSARPEQVKALFTRTLDTGIQHGTVTIMVGKEGYEVTTFRVDGDYTDGRHPDTVTFTPSLEEDLKRRDFTINAMAYSHATGIVDAFDGVADLKARRIRCVGNAMERFTEDALRILRAIRFSAQLGFEIEDATRQAITEIAPNLVHVSKERIQVELTKLLLSDRPEAMKLVYETGISPYVSETFHKMGEMIGDMPVTVPAKKSLRWALFLRKGTPEQAVRILRDLKLDNDTIYQVKVLTGWIERSICGEIALPDEKTDEMCTRDNAAELEFMPGAESKPQIRKVMSQMEPELFDDLLNIKLCLAKAAAKDSQSVAVRQLENICALRDEIRADGNCISLKMLAVTGNDLIKAGMKPGKEVGQTLHHFLELVLDEPEKNDKEYLLEILKLELYDRKM